MQPAKCPTGLTIIGVLNIIGGIIMLIGGIALVAVGSILPGALLDTEMSGLPAGALGALGVGMGGIILALGIFSFIVAYGLLKGLGWAWTLTVVLSVISIALNAISIASGRWKNYQHHYQRSHTLLPVQATREGVFRQGRKSRGAILAFQVTMVSMV